ncbi:hypothetical protein T09_9347 [Trichinella sp. T9]|nr:hypothetical protein T09_9347 [Trichinella sp. T9]
MELLKRCEQNSAENLRDKRVALLSDLCVHFPCVRTQISRPTNHQQWNTNKQADVVSLLMPPLFRVQRSSGGRCMGPLGHQPGAARRQESDLAGDAQVLFLLYPRPFGTSPWAGHTDEVGFVTNLFSIPTHYYLKIPCGNEALLLLRKQQLRNASCTPCFLNGEQWNSN